MGYEIPSSPSGHAAAEATINLIHAAAAGATLEQATASLEYDFDEAQSLAEDEGLTFGKDRLRFAAVAVGQRFTLMRYTARVVDAGSPSEYKRGSFQQLRFVRIPQALFEGRYVNAVERQTDALWFVADVEHVYFVEDVKHTQLFVAGTRATKRVI